MKDNWFVYIVECSNTTLYTGITTDIDRRVGQHNDGTGAKYTRGKAPVTLLYLKDGYNRSTASIEERRIKRLTRLNKLKLISENKLI